MTPAAITPHQTAPADDDWDAEFASAAPETGASTGAVPASQPPAAAAAGADDDDGFEPFASSSTSAIDSAVAPAVPEEAKVCQQ